MSHLRYREIQDVPMDGISGISTAAECSIKQAGSTRKELTQWKQFPAGKLSKVDLQR